MRKSSASAAIIYTPVRFSDKYSNKIQSINVIIRSLLITITALPKDICENILLYTPSEDQYQFIIFNQITIDNKYSIIQFILLIFNNICHFSLVLFIIIYAINCRDACASIQYTFAILYFSICILWFTEMFIIFYFYRRNYKIFICYESTQEILEVISQIMRSFTNRIDSILHICIYIPLTCIVLFGLNTNINNNYTLPINIIFFVPYFMTTIYECYMYHRQYILEKELIQMSMNARMTTHISTLIYLQINTVLLLIYSLIYSVLAIFIVSLLIIHGIPHLLLYIYIRTLTHIEGVTLFTLFLIFVESICIATLSWQLWNENQNNNAINSLQIASVIITILNMTIIYTFYYYFANHTTNDYYSANHTTNDEQQKGYINKFLWVHDICIILPTLIILFYYSNDSVSTPFSVYLTLIVIGLREFMRFLMSKYPGDHLFNGITFMLKYGIIMPVFGFMYLSSNPGVSTFFLSIGCFSWGAFILFAFAACCDACSDSQMPWDDYCSTCQTFRRRNREAAPVIQRESNHYI